MSYHFLQCAEYDIQDDLLRWYVCFMVVNYYKHKTICYSRIFLVLRPLHVLRRDNKLRLESYLNYSKAITKNPNNFFFYLERGKAKQNYGDFKGAINDFNYSFNLNPDKKIIFHRANAKFDYGDYLGAIEDYEKVIFINNFKNILYKCLKVF